MGLKLTVIVFAPYEEYNRLDVIVFSMRAIQFVGYVFDYFKKSIRH